jgi:hypothetical protein
MEPGCIGKYNTNNLPAPTDLTENPYGKKKTCKKLAKKTCKKMQLKKRPRWYNGELQ